MAIINAKRIEADEEADRQARQQATEYANRHDSAAWQQPPPAYEEASSAGGASVRQALTASSSSQTAPPSAISNDLEDALESPLPSRTRSPPRPRARSDDDGGSDSDESMPLLSNRERRKLKRTLRFKRRFRYGYRLIVKTVLVVLIVLLALRWIGVSGSDSITAPPRGQPNREDGKPIEDPSWSEPVKSPPDTWRSPSVPVYESEAWFSFPADTAVHFLRARGSSYTGVVRYAMADEMEDQEWKKVNRGHVKDRIAVHVKADFTHVELRDSIRVCKMRIDDQNAEGIGIYGGELPNTQAAYIHFRLTVFLPAAAQRSASGLAYDGTSWIAQLEATTENFLIAHETSLEPREPEDYAGVSYGHVRFATVNGGISLASTIMANGSISMKTNNGYLRDVMFRYPRPFTVVAPTVSLSVLNGPVMVSGVVGIDEISMRTGSGGLNISTIATARRVTGTTVNGIIGGYYAGVDGVHIRAKRSDVIVDVDLARAKHDEIVEKSGLRKLLGPDAPRTDRSASRWLVKNVDVSTEIGETFVRYLHQERDTQLHSRVSSTTGSIKVIHGDRFEGLFDMRTSIGTIAIAQPGDSEHARRVFVLDRDERDRIGEKRVQGRTWTSDHDWSDGGSSSDSIFPVSTSTVVGQVGALHLRFE